MNYKMKGIIFENLLFNREAGLLVLRKGKIEFMNKKFKQYLLLLGIKASYKTLDEIRKNYNENFENFKKFSFLKSLMDKYDNFNSNKSKESINFVMTLDKFNVQIDYNGFTYNDEKYNVFTMKSLKEDIKLLNNKFYNISKKINEMSFKNISRSSFNSYDIFKKIHNILKNELMIDAFIVATKENNEIKIDFAKIIKNDFSGIYLPKSSLTGYICDLNEKTYFNNSLEIDLPKEYKIFHVAGPEIYSIYGIPFNDGDGASGTILYERKGRDSFMNHELKLLEELTYTIKSILKYTRLYEELNKEKEKLYKISIKDKLTHAYNRVFLEEYLANTLDRIRRYDENSVLVFIDIDNFKKINDKYGHNYGDTCLVFFSETVFDSIRNSDVFARYGGDEFIVVLNNADIKDAEKIISRLQNKLFNSHFKLSISYGIISLDKNKSIEDNFNKVDNLMYKMKDSK